MTSVWILCPRVPGPHICWGGWCSLHRAWRLWQIFRKVSVLAEFDSVKKEREDSSWHSRGSISVARSWSTDERNLKFLIVFGWGSSRVTFTLFIRDVSTIWENLLIYVLTRCLGQKLIFALLHISWRVMVIHILFDTKGQLSSVLFSFKSVKEWSAVPISALV